MLHMFSYTTQLLQIQFVFFNVVNTYNLMTILKYIFELEKHHYILMSLMDVYEKNKSLILSDTVSILILSPALLLVLGLIFCMKAGYKH